MTIAGTSTESLGVTTFTHEACEAVDAIAHYKSSTILNKNNDFQDVLSYFQRPRAISSGSFAFGSYVPYVEVITMPILKSWFPQLSGRLGGAYGWRFKLRFRLQVAATPFHQGIFAMSFEHGKIASVGQNLGYARTSHSALCTNIPHVRLDISELTAVELHVPFIFRDEFLVLDSTESYGTLSITPILPVISVSGLSMPDWNLYVSVEDIEVVGATAWTTSTITLQSGVMMKEIKDNHLVSKTFSTIAKVGNFIARGVPSLSAVAGPVAWAADIGAGLAKYFGYSRPLIQDPAVRVFRAANAHENNVDLSMTGNALGLFASNTLAISPEFAATDVDEMSLAYLFSRYSQICVGYVSATDGEGTTVYATPVSPACFWYRRPSSAPYCNIIYPKSSNYLISDSGNCFVPSHLMWWSSFFRAWRGTIKFRVTFAKTKYHGGRYLISYVPDVQERLFADFYTTVKGPEFVGGLVQPFGYSQMMDLKDSNVFEFEVPFMPPQPWLQFYGSTGAVTITCVDRVIHPSTVTSIIPFVVEVAGGSDFEANDYAGSMFAPAVAGYTIYTQSGIVPTPIEGVSPYTMGEKVMSVKQMIQSPGYASAQIAVNDKLRAGLVPWYAYIPSTSLRASASLPMQTSANFSGLGCVGSVIARCFKYVKGGTDHHIYNLARDPNLFVSVDQSIYTGAIAGNPVPVITDFIQRSLSSTTPKVFSMGTESMHIRSPAYQKVVRIQSDLLDDQSLVAFGANNGLYDQRMHGDSLIVFNATASTARIIYSRAASDDAALGYYLGPPPCVVPNTAQATPIERDYGF